MAHAARNILTTEFCTGLSSVRGGTAVLQGSAEFKFPDGLRGFYMQWFRRLHDGSADWRKAYGVQFDVLVPSGARRDLTVSILLADPARAAVIAKLEVAGAGWQTVTLPSSSFDIETARTFYLLHVKGLRIATAGKQALTIRDPRVTMGAQVALSAPVQGKAFRAGTSASYDVVVGNPTRAQLAAAFRAGLEPRIEKIGAALAQGDIESAIREAHAIKGSAATFTCPETVQRARQLETACQTTDKAAIAVALSALDQAYKRETASDAA